MGTIHIGPKPSWLRDETSRVAARYGPGSPEAASAILVVDRSGLIVMSLLQAGGSSDLACANAVPVLHGLSRRGDGL